VFVKILEELAVSIYQKYEAEPSDTIFTKDDEIAHANACHPPKQAHHAF
jgi:hypothetical protein